MALPNGLYTNSPLLSSSSSSSKIIVGKNVIVPATVVVGKSCTSRVSMKIENQASKIKKEEIPLLSRTSFPPGFTFGAGSSAFQVEGAAAEAGRGPSIWDTYAHNHPDKITDGSNGDVAVDQYHHYKEDVGIMKEMGMDAYRFSISWSRILPKGTIEGGVNQEGINYYNNLIDELLKNGIEPFVTIFHFDLPQALQDNYNGFLDKRIVDDYKAYAELCFQKFGDRVKHWTTMNEPWVVSSQGYGTGAAPPSRCTSGCLVKGDSATEPYIVTHNILLAHATVVALYREKYQAIYKGEIGITLVSLWPEPYDNLNNNIQASERWLDFMLGWFMEPLVTGDYPFIMRALVGDRLPSFTDEEKKMVKGSFDFIGLNYYFAKYAVSTPFNPNAIPQSYLSDAHVDLKDEIDQNDIPSNEPIPPNFNDPFPLGIYKLLIHTAQRYNYPPIYITENGRWQTDLGNLTIEEALNDKERMAFHKSHLAEVLNAIKGLGVNVKGYFAWSLLDSFEGSDGYTKRFGLYYTDYKDNLKRSPKNSALWFKDFLNK